MEKNTRITMKQYLTPEQTAKLIELGFEKPKNERWILDVANESTPSIQNLVKRQDYSIGELIEALDTVNETVHCRFGGVKANLVSTNSGYEKIGGELIDLLFDLCVKLKEEGVI